MSEEPRQRRKRPVVVRDKEQNRVETKEAVELLNEIRAETDVEPLKATELRDSGRRIVATALEETKEELKKRNEELKALKEEIAKKTGLDKIDKKMELTREELSNLGINLRSDFQIGAYRHLSKEAKDALDQEVAQALLQNMMRMLNILAEKPDDEIRGERSKDILLSLAILADKHKIFADRVPSSKAKQEITVTHTITDLISKSSQKKLGNLFSAEKDADIIDITPQNTQNNENCGVNDDEPTSDW